MNLLQRDGGYNDQVGTGVEGWRYTHTLYEDLKCDGMCFATCLVKICHRGDEEPNLEIQK